MIDQKKYLFPDRAHAFRKLSSRFKAYENQDCCVIATSNGTLPVAIALSKQLGSNLIFIPSTTIKDPGDSSRSIGVVSFAYAILENAGRDIPQDYIHSNVRRLRSELLSRYPGVNSPVPFAFQNRIVIVVDDVTQRSNDVIGLLKVIRWQQPNQIVVATPVITHSAAQTVIKKADVSIFIHMTDEDMIQRTYMNFNSITDDESVEVLHGSTTGLAENQSANKTKFQS